MRRKKEGYRSRSLFMRKERVYAYVRGLQQKRSEKGGEQTMRGKGKRKA
jgi:hypothetical protein